MKTCFKCKEAKPITEFYKHKMMADGHLGKCKECTKKDVRRWYAETRPQRSAYDRARSQLPERRKSVYECNRRVKMRHPDRARARNAVANAIRDGRLVREPCKFCGNTKVQAHHHSYLEEHWLDVTWACFKCHREKCHGQTVTVE